MEPNVNEKELGFVDVLCVIIYWSCRPIFQFDTDPEEVISLTPGLVPLHLLVTRSNGGKLLLCLDEGLRSFD